MAQFPVEPFDYNNELEQGEAAGQESEEEYGRRLWTPGRARSLPSRPPRSTPKHPRPPARPGDHSLRHGRRPPPPRWTVITEPVGIPGWPISVPQQPTGAEPTPADTMGSEYVRWVQSSLNRIMGLQLPVDGIMSPETRNAIREFQRSRKLPEDGIVGPDTERALKETSGATGTPPAEEFEWEWGNSEGEGEMDSPRYELEMETATQIPGSRSRARRYPAFSLEPFLLRALGRATPQRELEFPNAPFEMEGELTGARLTTAVNANRRLARQLGWGCVVNDRLQLEETPRPRLYDLVGLGAHPSEEDFAQAVAQFQEKELGQRSGDGQLGPATWNQLLKRGVLPNLKFAPFAKPVFFGGRQIGVLEKTAPLQRCFFDPNAAAPCRGTRSGIAGEGAGAMIELGFRVTDMDAARRAGFVTVLGAPFFRWIQIVEFVTVPVFNVAGGFTGFVRRASGEIDPTTVVGIPPAQIDLSPYYWDEATLGGASPGLNIDQWINRRAQNGLCYDLIFQDRATFPMSTVSPPAPWTRPGSHAYFNFELALVGVKPGPPIQNFVLYTIKWGYDIFMKDGQPNVDLNALYPGTTSGSPAFKKIMNREFNRDDVPFPGHCMAGSGYTGRANCRK